jgi:hypothetical protein
MDRNLRTCSRLSGARVTRNASREQRSEPSLEGQVLNQPGRSGLGKTPADAGIGYLSCVRLTQTTTYRGATWLTSGDCWSAV